MSTLEQSRLRRLQAELAYLKTVARVYPDMTSKATRARIAELEHSLQQKEAA